MRRLEIEYGGGEDIKCLGLFQILWTNTIKIYKGEMIRDDGVPLLVHQHSYFLIY